MPSAKSENPLRYAIKYYIIHSQAARSITCTVAQLLTVTHWPVTITYSLDRTLFEVLMSWSPLEIVIAFPWQHKSHNHKHRILKK